MFDVPPEVFPQSHYFVVEFLLLACALHTIVKVTRYLFFDLFPERGPNGEAPTKKGKPARRGAG